MNVQAASCFGRKHSRTTPRNPVIADVATAADGRAGTTRYNGALSKPFYLAVGSRMRAIREAAGLSQEAFAAAAGMNPKYAWRVEAGLQNLSLLSIGRAALALGVSPAARFEGVEVNPRSSSRRPAATPARRHRRAREMAARNLHEPGHVSSARRKGELPAYPAGVLGSAHLAADSWTMS